MKIKTRPIGFRIPEDLFSFYEEKAKRERRRVSDVVRFALEDQRKAEEDAGKRKRSSAA